MSRSPQPSASALSKTSFAAVNTGVAAAHGQGATATEVLAIAERLLGSAEVVRIPEVERPLYTTRELLGLTRQRRRQLVALAAMMLLAVPALYLLIRFAVP